MKIKTDFEPLLTVNTNLNNICFGLECFSFLFCLPHIPPPKIVKREQNMKHWKPLSMHVLHSVAEMCFGVVEIHVLKKQRLVCMCCCLFDSE